jgi:magnesium-transporting ATPase (P-type)
MADSKSYTRLLFTSNRKRSAIIVLKGGDHWLYTYGSADIMLKTCDKIYTVNDQEVELTPAILTQIRDTMNASNGRSLRTLGIAFKKLKPGDYDIKNLGEATNEVYPIETQGLTYIGFVGMKDPLRAGVPEAVLAMARAGVTVRMVTGDKKETAIAIAKECHILPENDHTCLVMEGEEFNRTVGGLIYKCKECEEKNKNDASQVRLNIPDNMGVANKDDKDKDEDKDKDKDKKDDKEGGEKKKPKHPCPNCNNDMQPVAANLDEFRKIVDKLRVIAVCRPEDKYLLVGSLKYL